jgi:lysophospholipase L1-like esterase
MFKAMGLALGLGLLAAAPVSAAPATGEWLRTWAASPLPPTLVSNGPRNPVSARYENQTLRQIVRISAGGSKVRVRFSNEYGATPLEIGAAHIGVAGDNGTIQPGTDHVLTFSGGTTASVPAGAPILSDPVDMKVDSLASLTVSLYLPGQTGPCTCHQTGAQTGLVSDVGDFTAAPSFPVKSSFQFRAYLTGVEVLPERAGKTIVVLGDSISDGAVSSPDKNQRWPDRLAERLEARDRKSQAWAVANAGISGNRLLSDGTGQSALVRLDRDVLAVPGAAYVVLFVGVNDLGVALGGAQPSNPNLTAAQMIAGYRQIIARAHARGLKIYGATVTPYEGAAYWSAKGEAIRQEINSFIRTGGEYDGVIDFDAAWRDPAKPTAIRENLQPGDHLHGNDAGYGVLGDAVDLKLFK